MLPDWNMPFGAKLKLPSIGRHAGAPNGAQTGVPKPAPVGQLMFALRSSHGFS